MQVQLLEVEEVVLALQLKQRDVSALPRSDENDQRKQAFRKEFTEQMKGLRAARATLLAAARATAPSMNSRGDVRSAMLSEQRNPQVIACITHTHNTHTHRERERLTPCIMHHHTHRD